MRAAALSMAGIVAVACAKAEDPARAALRQRLQQEARLSDADITQLRGEVGRAIDGRTVQIKEGGAVRPLTPEQRSIVFEMLTNPAGVFDEGIQREDGRAFRVLNGPGRSDNAEIEASQRLWIDVDSLQPYRFKFAYAFPGYGDYTFDLVVQP